MRTSATKLIVDEEGKIRNEYVEDDEDVEDLEDFEYEEEDWEDDKQ